MASPAPAPDLYTAVDGTIRGTHLLSHVEDALRNGASVNATTGPVLPLQRAVQARHAALVDTLLEARASPDATDAKGVGPLHMAAFDGKRGILELLLNAKANVDVRDKHGQTPLFFAPNKSVCEMLLRARADVDALNDKGQTAMHLAAHAGLEGTITWLAKKMTPGMVNHRDRHGRTAAYLASRMNLPSTVTLLEQFGADVALAPTTTRQQDKDHEQSGSKRKDKDGRERGGKSRERKKDKEERKEKPFAREEQAPTVEATPTRGLPLGSPASGPVVLAPIPGQVVINTELKPTGLPLAVGVCEEDAQEHPDETEETEEQAGGAPATTGGTVAPAALKTPEEVAAPFPSWREPKLDVLEGGEQTKTNLPVFPASPAAMEAFSRLDANNDGFVDAQEFAKFFDELSPGDVNSVLASSAKISGVVAPTTADEASAKTLETPMAPAATAEDVAPAEEVVQGEEPTSVEQSGPVEESAPAEELLPPEGAAPARVEDPVPVAPETPVEEPAPDAGDAAGAAPEQVPVEANPEDALAMVPVPEDATLAEKAALAEETVEPSHQPEEPAPTVEDATLADESASIAEEAAPTPREVACVEEEVAPDEEAASPAVKEAALAENPTPAVEGVASAEETFEFTPAAEEGAPLVEQAAAVAEETAPAKQDELKISMRQTLEASLADGRLFVSLNKRAKPKVFAAEAEPAQELAEASCEGILPAAVEPEDAVPVKDLLKSTVRKTLEASLADGRLVATFNKRKKPKVFAVDLEGTLPDTVEPQDAAPADVPPLPEGALQLQEEAATVELKLTPPKAELTPEETQREAIKAVVRGILEEGTTDGRLQRILASRPQTPASRPRTSQPSTEQAKQQVRDVAQDPESPTQGHEQDQEHVQGATEVVTPAPQAEEALPTPAAEGVDATMQVPLEQLRDMTKSIFKEALADGRLADALDNRRKRPWCTQAKQEMSNTFARFDVNRDGFIDEPEFRAMKVQLMEEVREQAKQEVLQAYPEAAVSSSVAAECLPPPLLEEFVMEDLGLAPGDPTTTLDLFGALAKKFDITELRKALAVVEVSSGRRVPVNQLPCQGEHADLLSLQAEGRQDIFEHLSTPSVQFEVSTESPGAASTSVRVPSEAERGGEAEQEYNEGLKTTMQESSREASDNCSFVEVLTEHRPSGAEQLLIKDRALTTVQEYPGEGPCEVEAETQAVADLAKQSAEGTASQAYAEVRTKDIKNFICELLSSASLDGRLTDTLSKVRSQCPSRPGTSNSAVAPAADKSLAAAGTQAQPASRPTTPPAQADIESGVIAPSSLSVDGVAKETTLLETLDNVKGTAKQVEGLKEKVATLEKVIRDPTVKEALQIVRGRAETCHAAAQLPAEEAATPVEEAAAPVEEAPALPAKDAKDKLKINTRQTLDASLADGRLVVTLNKHTKAAAKPPAGEAPALVEEAVGPLENSAAFSNTHQLKINLRQTLEASLKDGRLVASLHKRKEATKSFAEEVSAAVEYVTLPEKTLKEQLKIDMRESLEMSAKDGRLAAALKKRAKPKKCATCCEVMLRDAAFCKKCGAKRVSEVSLLGTGDKCPDCGEMILSDEVFCRKCGVRLPECVKTGEMTTSALMTVGISGTGFTTLPEQIDEGGDMLKAQMKATLVKAQVNGTLRNAICSVKSKRALALSGETYQDGDIAGFTKQILCDTASNGNLDEMLRSAVQFPVDQLDEDRITELASMTRSPLAAAQFDSTLKHVLNEGKAEDGQTLKMEMKSLLQEACLEGKLRQAIADVKARFASRAYGEGEGQEASAEHFQGFTRQTLDDSSMDATLDRELSNSMPADSPTAMKEDHLYSLLRLTRQVLTDAHMDGTLQQALNDSSGARAGSNAEDRTEALVALTRQVLSEASVDGTLEHVLSADTHSSIPEEENLEVTMPMKYSTKKLMPDGTLTQKLMHEGERTSGLSQLLETGETGETGEGTMLMEETVEETVETEDTQDLRKLMATASMDGTIVSAVHDYEATQAPGQLLKAEMLRILKDASIDGRLDKALAKSMSTADDAELPLLQDGVDFLRATTRELVLNASASGSLSKLLEERVSESERRAVEELAIESASGAVPRIFDGVATGSVETQGTQSLNSTGGVEEQSLEEGLDEESDADDLEEMDADGPSVPTESFHSGEEDIDDDDDGVEEEIDDDDAPEEDSVEGVDEMQADASDEDIDLEDAEDARPPPPAEEEDGTEKGIPEAGMPIVDVIEIVVTPAARAARSPSSPKSQMVVNMAGMSTEGAMPEFAGEVRVKNMKLMIREMFDNGSADGRLAEALANARSRASSRPETPASPLHEAPEGDLEWAPHSGQESLKENVRARLVASLTSGSLGEAMAASSKQDQQRFKANLRELLETASMDGRLKGALDTCKNADEAVFADPIPEEERDVKHAARDMLQRASRDGRLADVLAAGWVSEQRDEQATHTAGNARMVLSSASLDGSLPEKKAKMRMLEDQEPNAVDNIKPTAEQAREEELKIRMRDSLVVANLDGRLAKELAHAKEIWRADTGNRSEPDQARGDEVEETPEIGRLAELPPAPKEETLRAFNRFDLNQDGVIDAMEFQIMQGVLEQEMDDQMQRAHQEPVMLCPSCGSVFKYGAKFCRECGTQRPEAVGAEPQPTCAGCSNIFMSDSKFCRSCGLKRTEAPCMAASELEQPAMLTTMATIRLDEALATIPDVKEDLNSRMGTSANFGEAAATRDQLCDSSRAAGTDGRFIDALDATAAVGQNDEGTLKQHMRYALELAVRDGRLGAALGRLRRINTSTATPDEDVDPSAKDQVEESAMMAEMRGALYRAALDGGLGDALGKFRKQSASAFRSTRGTPEPVFEGSEQELCGLVRGLLLESETNGKLEEALAEVKGPVFERRGAAQPHYDRQQEILAAASQDVRQQQAPIARQDQLKKVMRETLEASLVDGRLAAALATRQKQKPPVLDVAFEEMAEQSSSVKGMTRDVLACAAKDGRLFEILQIRQGQRTVVEDLMQELRLAARRTLLTAQEDGRLREAIEHCQDAAQDKTSSSELQEAAPARLESALEDGTFSATVEAVQNRRDLDALRNAKAAKLLEAQSNHKLPEVLAAAAAQKMIDLEAMRKSCAAKLREAQVNHTLSEILAGALTPRPHFTEESLQAMVRESIATGRLNGSLQAFLGGGPPLFTLELELATKPELAEGELTESKSAPPPEPDTRVETFQALRDGSLQEALAPHGEAEDVLAPLTPMSPASRSRPSIVNRSTSAEFAANFVEECSQYAMEDDLENSVFDVERCDTQASMGFTPEAGEAAGIGSFGDLEGDQSEATALRERAKQLLSDACSSELQIGLIFYGLFKDNGQEAPRPETPEHVRATYKMAWETLETCNDNGRLKEVVDALEVEVAAGRFGGDSGMASTKFADSSLPPFSHADESSLFGDTRGGVSNMGETKMGQTQPAIREETADEAFEGLDPAPEEEREGLVPVESLALTKRRVRRKTEPVRVVEAGITRWEVRLVKQTESDKFGFGHSSSKAFFIERRGKGTDGPQHLLIKAVKPQGLLSEWNEAHPGLAVDVGDRVTAVNGKKNLDNMAKELRTSSDVTLCLARFGESFTLHIPARSQDRKLGIRFDNKYSEGDAAKLRITQVAPEGLMEELNEYSISKGRWHAVAMPGMGIYSVNDSFEPAEMSQLLKDCDGLTICFCRALADRNPNLPLPAAWSRPSSRRSNRSDSTRKPALVDSEDASFVIAAPEEETFVVEEPSAAGEAAAAFAVEPPATEEASNPLAEEAAPPVQTAVTDQFKANVRQTPGAYLLDGRLTASLDRPEGGPSSKYPECEPDGGNRADGGADTAEGLIDRIDRIDGVFDRADEGAAVGIGGGAEAEPMPADQGEDSGTLDATLQTATLQTTALQSMSSGHQSDLSVPMIMVVSPPRTPPRLVDAGEPAIGEEVEKEVPPASEGGMPISEIEAEGTEPEAGSAAMPVPGTPAHQREAILTFGEASAAGEVPRALRQEEARQTLSKASAAGEVPAAMHRAQSRVEVDVAMPEEGNAARPGPETPAHEAIVDPPAEEATADVIEAAAEMGIQADAEIDVQADAEAAAPAMPPTPELQQALVPASPAKSIADKSPRLAAPRGQTSREVFNRFDLDQDGVIDAEEFEQIHEQLLREAELAAEAKRLAKMAEQAEDVGVQVTLKKPLAIAAAEDQPRLIRSSESCVCGTNFLIDSKYCMNCGLKRPLAPAAHADALDRAGEGSTAEAAPSFCAPAADDVQAGGDIPGHEAPAEEPAWVPSQSPKELVALARLSISGGLPAALVQEAPPLPPPLPPPPPRPVEPKLPKLEPVPRQLHVKTNSTALKKSTVRALKVQRELGVATAGTPGPIYIGGGEKHSKRDRMARRAERPSRAERKRRRSRPADSERGAPSDTTSSAGVLTPRSQHSAVPPLMSPVPSNHSRSSRNGEVTGPDEETTMEAIQGRIDMEQAQACQQELKQTGAAQWAGLPGPVYRTENPKPKTIGLVARVFGGRRGRR